MIFKQLKLINFKSHINTTINFEEGISLIVGQNGAGKSSIFEAISFALYKQYTGKKLTDLVRSNKDETVDRMSVSLTFLCNGINYKVIRERTKSSSKATLLKEAKESFDFIPVCSGDKEVNKEISKILEMDSDLFLNAIYVRQGEIANLVAKTPSERKLLISKLLKLEELEKTWRNSLPLINNYEKKIANLNGLIESDSTLGVELKAKKQDFVNLSVRKESLNKEIESLEASKEKILKDKSKIEEEKRAFEEFNLKLDAERKLYDSIKKQKEDLQNQIDEIAKMEKEKDRLEKYTKKLPIYLDFEDACRNIVILQKEQKQEKEKLEQIESFKSTIENKRGAHEDYIAMESKINSLNEEKSKLSADLKIISQYKEDVGKVEKDLNKEKTKLNDFISKTKDVLGSFISENELEDVENDFDFVNLRKTADALKGKLKEDLTSREEQINNLNKELNLCELNIDSSKKSLDELNDVEGKCPICQSDISEDKKDELINSYSDVIMANETKIKDIQERLKEMNNFNRILYSKITLLEDFEKEIYANKDLAHNISNYKKRISELNLKLDKLSDTNNKLKEFDDLISSANKNKEELKKAYDEHNGAQTALKSLAKDHEIQENLYIIQGKINSELERVNEAINSDMYLSAEMPEEELEKKIADLKEKDKRFNELSTLIRRKPKVSSSLQEKKEELKRSVLEIERLNQSIKTSLYDKDAYEKIKLLEESTSLRIEKSKTDFSETFGKLKMILSRINEIEEALKVNKAYKEELKNTEKFVSLLNNIRSLYGKDGIQKTLRNASRPLIQKNTKEFFEKFDFEYSDLRLDEDYEISLYGPEGESRLDMVSGGEKIAIALALRLGITQAMANGSIESILLDEPTIHLDDYRRKELINLLRSMSVIPQMIIVTHDEDLESAADHIFKVEKINGLSSVNEEDVSLL